MLGSFVSLKEGIEFGVRSDNGNYRTAETQNRFQIRTLPLSRRSMTVERPVGDLEIEDGCSASLRLAAHHYGRSGT